MSQLSISISSVRELKPNPANARTHSVKQVRQIAGSIRSFGFNNPVLIDSQGTIIAGHGRVEAAKELGMTSVPTVRLEHLSDAQKRAYIIADNRLAELAGWDREILAIELQNLLDDEIDFEITDVGFETAEIDLILGDMSGDSCEPDLDDEVPPVRSGPSVAKSGDLWLVGPHRIYCGNALEAESYSALMDGELAQMVFADPPYNVPINGHVSGLGKIRHEEFAMATGEMSEAEFTDFLSAAFQLMSAASVDGSIHFICMDWRHLFELLQAGKSTFAELKNMCVWAKNNGGMGSLYRSQHELVAVFKKGDGPHINNVELGKHGRYRTNVWAYPGMNSFQSGRDDKLAMHPTVKPVGLVADAILDCSKRGGIVLDPFAGSGTTLVAAERTGRRCFALEFEPSYVDVSLRRFRKLAGTEPVCAKTGDTFSQRETQTSSDEVDAVSPISSSNAYGAQNVEL